MDNSSFIILTNMSDSGNCTNPDFPNESYKDMLAFNSVITIISLLGLIGNGISGIVLTMPQMRSSYNLLLFGLTVVDSIQLIFFCITYGSQALWYLDVILRPEIISPIYPFALMWFYVAHTISIYIIVLLSLERYIAVCRPFKANKLFPNKRCSCCYILIICLLSILYNLPKWLELELCQVTVKVSDPAQQSWSHFWINNTGPSYNYSAPDDPQYIHYEVVVYSKIFENTIYKLVYRGVIDNLVNFIIPSVFIIAFNIWIFRGIREANQKRQSLTLTQFNDSSKTLVLIAILFAICDNPAWVVTVYLLRRLNMCTPGSVLSCQRFTVCLLVVNTSLHFVIYCFYGSKFRQQLILLLGHLPQCVLSIFARNKK